VNDVVDNASRLNSKFFSCNLAYHPPVYTMKYTLQTLRRQTKAEYPNGEKRIESRIVGHRSPYSNRYVIVVSTGSVDLKIVIVQPRIRGRGQSITSVLLILPDGTAHVWQSFPAVPARLNSYGPAGVREYSC